MRSKLLLLLSLVLLACVPKSADGGSRKLLAEERPGGFIDQPGILGETVDCAEAYGSPNQCVRTACPAEWAAFIGAWEGPFLASIQLPQSDDDRRRTLPFYDEIVQAVPNIAQTMIYRPYTTRLAYVSKDCLQNTANGDVLIIGRQTDTYPAWQILPPKVRTANVVSGRHADGSQYLMIIYADDVPTYYKLVSHADDHDLFVWESHVDATDTHPALTWRLIDGRDTSVTDAERRMLTIALRVEAAGQPVFNGIVASGQHALPRR